VKYIVLLSIVISGYGNNTLLLCVDVA